MQGGFGPPVDENVKAAIAALAAGKIVLMYDADGREEETDMVVASQFATPEVFKTLRQDAGGLICTTVAPQHHQALGLPYLSDLLAASSAKHPVLGHLAADDIQYDPSKSSFGLTINHRSTFTGIPDEDRTKTVGELAKFVSHLTGDASKDSANFGAEFRAPGHCILLNAAPGLLATRQGHTELSVALAELANLVPSTTICEMLGPDGKALSRKAAQEYAANNGLVFITGQEVIDAWKTAQPQSVPTVA